MAATVGAGGATVTVTNAVPDVPPMLEAVYKKVAEPKKPLVGVNRMVVGPVDVAAPLVGAEGVTAETAVPEVIEPARLINTGVLYDVDDEAAATNGAADTSSVMVPVLEVPPGPALV